MAASAPYLTYARTLFGGTSVPGVGGSGPSPQRKVQPTAGQQAVQRPAQTFADLQAQGQARPAPPPAPAPTAAPAMSGAAPAPAVPDWLASAMRVPPTDEPTAPVPPTAPPAATPGAGPAALPPTASAPNTPPPATPTTQAARGGVGGYDPNQPPPNYDPDAWAVSPEDIKSGKEALYVDATGVTHRIRHDFAPGDVDGFLAYLATLPDETTRNAARQLNGAILQGATNLVDQYRLRGLGSAQIEQMLRQIGTAPTQQVTGGPAAPGGAPGAGGSDALPPWLAGDDLAQAYALQFQRGAENIDDEFNQKTTAIQEEMARRGLGDTLDSTIGGGRLYDTNVGRRSAKSDLLSQVAAQLGTSAWQRALAQQQFGLSQELGRGQLGLAQQAQANAMEQFRQQMGLSRDQFAEMMREYDLTRGDNNSQFQNQLWLALLPYLKDLLPAGTDLSSFGG